MNVRFKKLHKAAVTPSYAKPGDAGMDLTAVAMKPTDKYIEYDTGLAFEIPVGFVGLIFPRSSVSKTDLSLTNCVGVVDSGYRGPIKFRFRRAKDGHIKGYKAGDRIGQLVIMPYPSIELEEVEELTITDRMMGGFGSTN